MTLRTHASAAMTSDQRTKSQQKARTMKNVDIEDLALASYYRRARRAVSTTGACDQPARSGTRVDHERRRVVIRNSGRILAVYLYRDDGRRVVFTEVAAAASDEAY